MHICCRTISRPQNDKYELCWKLTLTTEPPGRLSWIPTIRIMLLSWPLLTTAGAASWDRLSSFLSHRLNTATILLCFGPMLQLKYKYLIEAVQCTWYPILYTLCIYNDKYYTYYTSNMKYQITCTYCCVTVAVTAAIPLCCWTMSEPSPVTMYCTPCLSCNITIVISVNTVIHIFLIIMVRINPNLSQRQLGLFAISMMPSIRRWASQPVAFPQPAPLTPLPPSHHWAASPEVKESKFGITNSQSRHIKWLDWASKSGGRSNGRLFTICRGSSTAAGALSITCGHNLIRTILLIKSKSFF